jgi:DNA-binding transcriptional MerR regulator
MTDEHLNNITRSALDLELGLKVYGSLMKISELADQVGVSTSAIRYYERIGILPSPDRTESGYRSYDDDSVARLVFVTQAKSIGLTLDQINDLLPIWDGVNCPETHDEISKLIDAKRIEVLERIEELQAFAAQLAHVRDSLHESPPPASCRPDMSCCMPVGGRPAPTPVAYLSDIRRLGAAQPRS